MEDWEDQEKKGELNTRPPLSPEYSDEDCEIVEDESADEAQDKALEAWASSLIISHLSLFFFFLSVMVVRPWQLRHSPLFPFNIYTFLQSHSRTLLYYLCWVCFLQYLEFPN